MFTHVLFLSLSYFFFLLNMTRNNYITTYRLFFIRSYQNLIFFIVLFIIILILYICSVC